MEISIEIDVVAGLALVGAIVVWLFTRILRFYDKLGSFLPARWMFIVFAVSFAAWSAVTAASLSGEQPIPQLHIIVQGVAFSCFVGALASCALCFVTASGGAIHKHLTRTRIYYVDDYRRITHLY